MQKTKISNKNTELTSFINRHFKGKLNLARIKLISYFVIALRKIKTLTFKKLVNAFNTSADSSSSLRSI